MGGVDACVLCHWGLRRNSLWGHEPCEGCADMGGVDACGLCNRGLRWRPLPWRSLLLLLLVSRLEEEPRGGALFLRAGGGGNARSTGRPYFCEPRSVAADPLARSLLLPRTPHTTGRTQQRSTDFRKPRREQAGSVELRPAAAFREDRWGRRGTGLLEDATTPESAVVLGVAGSFVVAVAVGVVWDVFCFCGARLSRSFFVCFFRQREQGPATGRMLAVQTARASKGRKSHARERHSSASAETVPSES